MNALLRFEKWCRKYYSGKIEHHSHDGIEVTLCGGGRKVSVDEYQLLSCGKDAEVRDVYPTLEEVVNHALDLWYNDQSDKWFSIFYHSSHEPTLAKLKDLTEKGELKHRHWTGNCYMVYLEEKTEQGAKDKLCAMFPADHQPTGLFMYEVINLGNYFSH